MAHALDAEHSVPTLFVYEWVTGGGLIAAGGGLPDTLLAEGLAMARAVAADAHAAGRRPILLSDLRVPTLAAAGETIEIDSRAAHDAAFERLCCEADHVLLIAPETDGALLAAVERAESLGARLISPGRDFVRVASDKQATADALGRAGVATPEATLLPPDAPLPRDFPYPAVAKPIDGAGSQDTRLVANRRDTPPAYAWPRRLERYVPGVPASVAVVGGLSKAGRGSTVALPPCRQRLSLDGRFRYAGGSMPLAPGLARRAVRLAESAIEALPTLVGYAGIDVVLGDDPDGTRDAVIEVNPRLTTSYVGLRHIVRGGLLPTMLAAAGGERPTLDLLDRPLSFDADGAVYWDDERADR